MRFRRFPGAVAGLLPQLLLLVFVAYLALPIPRSFLRGADLGSFELTDRNEIALRTVRSGSWGTAHWVRLEEMGDYLPMIAVEVEDRRFRHHPGIDPVGLARAALINIRAGRVRAGGSTITQQLARNRRPGTARTLAAKFIETLDAFRLERQYRKPEILEAWLNRVPFGNGAWGVEAAARLYFDRSCRELSPAQAAFLIGLVRAPSGYDPYRNRIRALARQQDILALLHRRGRLGDFEYRQARAESVIIRRPRGRFFAPHFCEYLLRTRPGLGRPPDSGPPVSRVRTTLDLPVQRACEALVERQLERLAGNRVGNAAVVVLDRHTGELRAMVGSRDWWNPDEGQVNACLSPRQTGSAVKPFVYALGFETGLSPADILPDLPTWFGEATGSYRPLNYDRQWRGPVSARAALACSYNIPAVRVLEEVGPERLLEFLRAAGATSLDRTASHYGLALALGVGDMRLLELTNAYRVLANYGEYTPVRVLADEAQAVPVRLLSPESAWLVTDILSDNEARAAGFGEFSCLDLPFPCAVKTGTSKDYRDNWAIGYSAGYAVGVWVGNFDGSPMRRVSGITGAGPLFRDIMLALHAADRTTRQAGPGFPPPDRIAEHRVCPVSGQKPGPWCQTTVREFFVRGRVRPGVCAIHRLAAFDRRTGRPVSDVSDSSAVEWRVVAHYPAQYRAWMSDRSGSVAFEFRTDEPRDSTRSVPRVLFPEQEDVFKIDPALPRSAQAVRFRASVPDGLEEAVWLLNGRELARTGPPYTWFWNLEPGRHQLRVRTRERLSEPVSFLVLP